MTATVTSVLGAPEWSPHGWLVRIEYRLSGKTQRGEISTMTIEEARGIKAGYQIQA